MKYEDLMENPIKLQIVKEDKIIQEWTFERKIFNELIVSKIIDVAVIHYDYLQKILDSNCHYDKRRKKWISIKKKCRKHKN